MYHVFDTDQFEQPRLLQLRKRNIIKIILGGMSDNLCVEAHLRELLEQGFEVIAVKVKTAGARHPELCDGYKAALIIFGYIANAVLSTDEGKKAMCNGLLEAAYRFYREVSPL